MENLKKIESKSLEEHKNELKRQFHIFKLSYIERLYDKKISPLEKSFIDVKYNEKNEKIETEIKVDVEDFELLLGRYSDIVEKLVRIHHEIENPKVELDVYTENYETLAKIYSSKIKEFYDTDKNTWMNKTLDLLDEMKKKLNKEKKEDNLNKDRSGLISTEVISYKKLETILQDTDFHINKDDQYLELHLRPLFELQYDKKDSNIFSENSLKQLAIDIINKYGEVKGIIGQSWILDTPIGKRIGFKILKRELIITPAFWGQFQDSKGQLVQERVSKFLETGEPPYMVATGIIDILDFLKKYLPQERKGEVVLKEKNKDFDYESFHNVNIKGNLMHWDDIGLEELETYFDQNKFFKMFCETEEGKDSKDLFIRLKKNNLKLQDLKHNKEWQEYAERFNKFIDSLMFKEKKVIIE